MPHKAIGDYKLLGIDLERCSTAQEHEMGQTVKGKDANGLIAEYRYVMFLDAITYVAGHAVSLASVSTWSVTNDRAGGTSLAAHIPVGIVFQTTVPTQNQYGWVQCRGIATVLIAGAAVVLGDILVCSPTVDGAAAEADYTGVAHLDLLPIGTALATIGDTATGAVMLSIGQ